ncbi:DUF3261 domain-containing protein [Vibrio mediterranei]|uniref:DUF3261 domain-containing protein n=1 Tax=Vibrio mediterranei TaxID=689 RepID=A0ABX5DA58_9VIBR|nr:DUF3261 domain-containing protein [Vibrio mediterranei]MCG9657346.1 DUF3261 domain-containing protein [Vibrio mediterranei]MCG9661902.1 DUF3261 domain-containing protein [Vibrio mediterranei]PCD86307.1 hypothetical protein COR52_21850 [Vibrio mediterranei]PRQ66108.1 hypothetical protein COR51_18510 [Vibrio mediterranei]SBO09249.1 hypothetical protein VME0621_01342 [Vibrio mediterranei]
MTLTFSPTLAHTPIKIINRLKQRIGTLIATLFLLVTTGCALQPQDASTQVQLNPNTSVELPTPAQLGYQLSASQLISATWQTPKGPESSQLPVQLQVGKDKLVLAGFSSWGTRIMSLSYQNNDIEANVLNGLENTVPEPEQILFNLMMTIWPKSAWEAPLSTIGWRIKDSTQQRQLIDETGATVITIRYSNPDPLRGKIYFEHQQLGYSIVIQTLNFQLNGSK